MRGLMMSLCLLAMYLAGCNTAPGPSRLEAGLASATNPVLDGHYADPSIVIVDGVVYLYATKDPWGGNDLACFSTTDFQTWEPHTLNWPTKEACQSETGTASRVWAPSVIHANNGKFYMYISVGGEVYCGVADHPLGPWSNVNEDQSPLIRNQREQDIHTIDAEAFIDDDGRAYLYWGSGWHWVNGHCLVVELAPDMHTFVNEPRDITPVNYFEAPFMVKRHGKYYLMYSDGRADRDTYKVRYAVSDNPLGPFDVEGDNSPILTTDADREVFGPGHHCVFSLGGKDYIAYHRLKERNPDPLLRQICIDRLHIRADGAIDPVVPTD